MTFQSKENTSTPESNEDFSKVKLPQKARPNIDHLIKRILVERRTQERKNFLVFLVVISIVIVASFLVYN